MEDLLILDQDRAPHLQALIAQRGLRVVQQASARVLVVEGEAGAVAALAQEAGVRSGQAPPMAEALPELGLTPGETLFIRAWLQRCDQGEKTRDWDGCPWDTSGFSAP